MEYEYEQAFQWKAGYFSPNYYCSFGHNSTPRVMATASSHITYVDLPLIRGLDVSSLLLVKENGGVFYRNDTQIDILGELAKLNFNLVRSRLWINPENGVMD